MVNFTNYIQALHCKQKSFNHMNLTHICIKSNSLSTSPQTTSDIKIQMNSMSRQHADIWSHPAHYLEDPFTWPWSPNGQDHIWHWKFKCQGLGQGQTHWSHLRPGVQSIRLLFVSWQFPYLTLKIQGHGHGQTRRSHLRPWDQSICLLFVLWQSYHFWLRYSKFHFWPWKIKVKVMAKVKLDGHIWGIEFNRCVYFSFRGNRTIFGWDIANSIFDLENSRSRPKSTKI